MYSNLNDEILDGILTVAFNKYIDREFAAMPSDDELNDLFPISKKSLRKAKRRMKEIKYRKPLPLVYLQRAAIVFLIFATLCFGVLITKQEIRAAIIHTFIKQFDGYTKFEFGVPEPPGYETLSAEEKQKEEDRTLKAIADLKIGYIPEGFELKTSTEESIYRQYKYLLESGEYLIISIYMPERVSISMDNEKHEIEAISINGYESYVNHSMETNTGSIFVSTPDYVIYVTAILSKDELIKVAENIR